MKTPITQKEIVSSRIGVLKQDQFDDWWASGDILVPFFNQEHVIRFINFNPNEDTNFIKEADELLSRFLQQTPGCVSVCLQKLHGFSEYHRF